ncbi:MAG: GGDEF domain-containing protein [Clostridia bacterium]|nr:GGDEF domain-containing protein [Clostridia bacterium]
MKSILSYFGYQPSLERENKFAFIIGIFGVLQLLSFLPFYAFVAKNIILVIETLIVLFAYMLVFPLFRKKRFLLAKNIIVFGFMVQVALLVLIWFPKETNFRYYYFIVAPISFFIFNFGKKSERTYIIFINLLAAILLIISDILQPLELLAISSSFTKAFSFMSLSFTIISEMIVFYFYAMNLHDTELSLKRLANTDALTNVANRRVLFKEGELFFHLCEDENSSFALVLLDIDYFKNINDQYGHPVGDEVLRILTSRISGFIRKNDLVCRYGGEEFAILFKALPNDYKRIIEQLKENIESDPFVIDNEKIHITASYGVVDCHHTFESFSAMVAIADKMLYKAKEAGRNQIKFYE